MNASTLNRILLCWIVIICLKLNVASSRIPEFRYMLSFLKEHNNDKQILAVPNIVEEFIVPFLKKLAQDENVAEILEEDVSDQCASHLTGWAQNFGELWSLSMLDATSKVNEGLLSGHTNSLGDLDECLAVRAQVNVSNSIESFKGHYCSATLGPEAMCTEENVSETFFSKRTMHIDDGFNINALEGGGGMFQIGFGIATCFPSTCSKNDVQNLLHLLLNGTGICLSVLNCQTDDRPKLSSGDIGVISLLGVIAGLCVVGTAIDLILTQPEGKDQSGPRNGIVVQSVIAFSLYTNISKWLNTNGGSDNLGCIHGIRFLSTCWVVLCHTWSTWPSKVWNLTGMFVMYEDWTIYPIVNGTISVDTFFTVAGLLLAYGLLKTLDKTKGRLNIPMVYLHRYLRLTPTYAILIGIMATWFQHFRPGPDTWTIAISAESCKKYWWHNLLYINNLVNYDFDPFIGPASCHGESWYLANDMQFFIVSPFIILAVWKWNLIGLLGMGLLTVASIATPVIVHYTEKLDATSQVFTETVEATFKKSYIKPWMRFGPYIAGLWGGYFLYKLSTRKSPLKLPLWIPAVGWLISTGTALAVIFGIMPHMKIDSEYKRLVSAIYAGFHRFAWGASITWVILACTAGYGGFINTFLSWKAFVPLGRLTFCTYLISMWLQTLFVNSMRQAITYDLYTGINLFFAHLVMSLLVSFVATMTLESPFIALEKIIFNKDKREANPDPAADKRPFEIDSKKASNESGEDGSSISSAKESAEKMPDKNDNKA